MKTISIGRDFSPDPAGRTIELDGDDSGEAFRERVLVPALKELGPGEVLEIVLDDEVISYGSSFLSEGFGGVVREGHMSSEELLDKVSFSYSRNNKDDFSFFERKIVEYIKAARKRE